LQTDDARHVRFLKLFFAGCFFTMSPGQL
jgi:hypothetical protein